MSAIKGKNTKPEMVVRKHLHSLGFRYRLHDKTLPGKPDLVFPKYKTVLFIHGCFWHRHSGCKYSVTPKSNTEFWEDKLSKNVERDKQNIETLQTSGWRVLILWECELKTKEHTYDRIKALSDELLNDTPAALPL